MSEYIQLPMKDGSLYRPTNGEIDHYEAMFPNINVAQEFCAMQVWLECNPSRRKTKRGIKRFVGSWLIRATQRQETPLGVKAAVAVGRNFCQEAREQ